MDPLTDQLPIKQSDYPCRTTYQHTRRLRLSVDADSLAGRADRSGDLRRPRGLESRPRQGRPDRPAARRRRPGGRSTSTWPRRRRPTASSVRALASWEATARRRARPSSSRGSRSMGRGSSYQSSNQIIPRRRRRGAQRARVMATRETNRAYRGTHRGDGARQSSDEEGVSLCNSHD